MAIAPSSTARRPWLAIPAALGAFVAVPLLLVAVGRSRLGSASPLAGMDPPWRWSIRGLRRWGGSLSNGLETVDQLLDVFVRVGLVVAWFCVVVIAWTMLQEVVYQLRHGMPSSRHGGGLGWIGRTIAAGLVAILPIASAGTTMADAGASPWRLGTAAALVGPSAPVSTVATLPVDVPVNLSRAADAPLAVTTNRVHVVAVGESMWSIAERYAAHPEQIDAVAASIVAANTGKVMVDGHRFTTPALIEAGWHLQLPDDLPSSSVIVQPGDSYWKLADDHLDAAGESSEAAVLQLTEELIAHNSPRLGYSDQTMLHPGDVVEIPSAPGVDDSLPAERPPNSIDETKAEPDPAPVAEPPVSTGAEPQGPTGPQPTTPTVTTPDPAQMPVDVPTNSAPAPIVDDSARRPSNRVPLPIGLAGAAALAAGVIAGVESRRRRRLRSLQIGQRLATPHPSVAAVERTLRSVSAAEQVARLDVALRAVASDLADQQSAVAAAIVTDDGAITIIPAVAALPLDQRWIYDVDTGWWTLPAALDVIELGHAARRSDQPCPTMVHVGRADLGNLYLDLEAAGVVAVQDCPDLVRSVAAALAVPPLGEDVCVVQHGLQLPETFDVERLESIDEVLRMIDRHSEAIAAVCTGSTTFATRSRRQSVGDTAPLVVVAASADGATVDELRRATGAGAGVAAVVGTVGEPIESTEPITSIRPDDDDRWQLLPWKVAFQPVRIGENDLEMIASLLDVAEGLPVAEMSPDDPDNDSTDDGWAVAALPWGDDEWPSESVESAESEVGVADGVAIDLGESVASNDSGDEPDGWSFVVRLFGPVEVQTADGESIEFGRSKAEELVVWMAQHRGRSTRSAARTALWDLDVRDATFSNVVSDARRALARASAPPDGEEWIGRTLTEQLPLHPGVVSDAQLIEQLRTEAATDPSRAVPLLQEALRWVRGNPFESSTYLWPDAEGITSNLVILATGAAIELAELALDAGDPDLAFWATEQGLRVLPGHEQLVAIRMRTHYAIGSLAGVRVEWESYERALRADVWSDGEPSPMLASLRRELLSGAA